MVGVNHHHNASLTLSLRDIETLQLSVLRAFAKAEGPQALGRAQGMQELLDRLLAHWADQNGEVLDVSLRQRARSASGGNRTTAASGS